MKDHSESKVPCILQVSNSAFLEFYYFASFFLARNCDTLPRQGLSMRHLYGVNSISKSSDEFDIYGRIF